MSKRVRSFTCTKCARITAREHIWLVPTKKGTFPLCRTCSKKYARHEREAYNDYTNDLLEFFVGPSSKAPA